MAKKNITYNSFTSTDQPRSATKQQQQQPQRPSDQPSTKTPRLSPTRTTQSGTSPSRTSPGLLAGHYAGCKWTEPPLPSALPPPPKRWMQTTSSLVRQTCKPDIGQQLKVLLKVQA